MSTTTLNSGDRYSIRFSLFCDPVNIRNTDAGTIADSTIASIHWQQMLRLLDIPSLRHRIVLDLAAGYYILHGIIEARTPQAKIRRHLIFLMESDSDPKTNSVISTTQEAIAQAIGLTRETVNKHLHELENSRIIGVRRGEIEITDESRLRFTDE